MDFYLGTVFPFAGSFAPVNTQQCLGQPVNSAQYQALWAVTAGAFGSGQNAQTFNLPDLRGRVMVGPGTSPYTGSTINTGNSGGAQFTTINGANLPAHTHATSFQGGSTGGSVPFSGTVTVPLNPAVGTSNSPSAIPAVLGGQLLTEPGLGVTLDGPYIPASSLPTPPTGSSLTGALSTQGTVSGGPTGATVAVSPGGGVVSSPIPLNNLQPYQSLFFFIFMLGYFPSRD
ncbi:phage tail protein [Azospirillum formosense]|uniref:Phage tail protein n=1 Tax=Azospirillum formosense TaxID=861533 RepID=A0ABX2L024_9PROT|nr:tail fiber protein [Azospirillum formosense]MBY3756265.1 phage tail protein [Azospirillum formosense]NUB22176.1 phage tail protein [Azospirillum formosense]